jgi:hypothetical protein
MTGIITALSNVIALALFGAAAFIIIWVLLRSRSRVAQKAKRWSSLKRAILLDEIFRR